MKADIQEVVQKVSLDTGESYSTLVIRLPSGRKIQLPVPDDIVVMLMEDLANSNLGLSPEDSEEEEYSPPEQSVPAETYFGGDYQAPAEQTPESVAAQHGFKVAPSAEEQIDTNDYEYEESTEESEDDNGESVQRQVVRKKKVKKKHRIVPSRTVPKDEMGYPIVPMLGNVQPAVDVDEDGARSI